MVDVFSSGVVLFAMISGRYPFEWARPDDPLYKLIVDKKYDEFWEIFSRYSGFSAGA